jgi:hypothetical protein
MLLLVQRSARQWPSALPPSCTDSTTAGAGIDTHPTSADIVT